MKKSIALVFVLALALCGMAGAFAQSEKDFEVSTKDGKVTVTKFKGKGGAVVIPATIGGNPVVEIGISAFEMRENITSVTIPAGVIRISNQVFIECTKLTSVSIPASVTSIMIGAFEHCTGLTSISIGANVVLGEIEELEGKYPLF
ncbi:MAG: hypothetical protein Ta2B_12950 [Termitinemataceae bacterium]|nr:MAG: hypothetical protein Ta2B_12950 [Termitinemataceae bacterium]